MPKSLLGQREATVMPTGIWIRRPAKERFFAKVKVFADGCWEWQGCKTRKGYAHFKYQGGCRASRFAYFTFVGVIPEGLQLDHLCRNRGCVNPSHLEPVTCKENLLRGHTLNARNVLKTLCPQGHHYNEVNTYRHPNGSRDCRICRYEAHKRWRNKLEKEILL